MTHRPDHTLDRARHLLGQDPPQAYNAERSLLSCVLQDATALAVAQDAITDPDRFAKPAHAFVWEAVTAIAGKGGEVNLSAVEAVLAGRGVLSSIGGADYLVDLWDTEARPTPATAKTLAEAVVAMHVKRRLVALGQRLIVEGHEAPDEPSALLDRLQAEAMAVGAVLDGHTGGTGMASLSDILDPDKPRTQGAVLPTGYYDLDQQLGGGPRCGQISIIGARPSMGKSSLMTGMAVGQARQGTPVAVFSLEMDKPSLGLRILSAASRVSARRIEADQLIERSMEWDNVQQARAELSRLPIYIDDTPGLTAMQLRARVRRMIAEHGVRSVYIDYLQRMTGDPKLPREQQVATLSKATADMAREFGLSVNLLCQLNRQSENREGHRPRMSDLRESGSIEQDADVVALIHRPDYYALQKDRSHQPDGVAEVIIAKQRNGPTGVVRLHFDAETAAMLNAASSEQGAGQEELVYV